MIRARRRGQAAVEYAVITAAVLGFTVLSWPFTGQLVAALDRYYQSIYWVIRSPVP